MIHMFIPSSVPVNEGPFIDRLKHIKDNLELGENVCRNIIGLIFLIVKFSLEGDTFSVIYMYIRSLHLGLKISIEPGAEREFGL